MANLHLLNDSQPNERDLLQESIHIAHHFVGHIATSAHTKINIKQEFCTKCSEITMVVLKQPTNLFKLSIKPQKWWILYKNPFDTALFLKRHIAT